MDAILGSTQLTPHGKYETMGVDAAFRACQRHPRQQIAKQQCVS
jgi:hypothetical protein